MPVIEDSGTVRSVERALQVIELLGEHDALGLEELHCLTHLPKATVSRLLHTLQALHTSASSAIWPKPPPR